MVRAVSEELINLLERHRDDSHISGCLELMTKADEMRQSADIGLPLRQTIDIYSTRARINQNLNGGKIKGYDSLLSALADAEVTTVKLQSFELLDRYIVVFTDELVSQLFGVLNCPKAKPSWFHPETGYE